MKRFIATLALIALINGAVVAPAYAVEDDSQMMQMSTNSAPAETTPDEASMMRTQGSEVQPAGTGTDAATDNTATPDPAIQTYMSGESDGDSQTAPDALSDTSHTTAYVIGGLIVAAAIAGFLVVYKTNDN